MIKIIVALCAIGLIYAADPAPAAAPEAAAPEAAAAADKPSVDASVEEDVSKWNILLLTPTLSDSSPDL